MSCPIRYLFGCTITPLLLIYQMSGAMILSALLEVALGAFGILNILLRFIGPITASVCITLIGVSLTDLPVIYGRPSYLMSIGWAKPWFLSVYLRPDKTSARNENNFYVSRWRYKVYFQFFILWGQFMLLI